MSILILNILVVVFLFGINFYIITYFFPKKKIDKILFFALFIIHYSCLIFAYYNRQHHLDFLGHKEIILNSNTYFSHLKIGTSFVSFLLYPLIKLNLFTITIYFIFFTFSLIVFYQLFNKTIDAFHENFKIKISVLSLFLLLPSYHLWASLPGKDFFVFFALFQWIFLFQKHKFLFLQILCLLLIFMIRQYICIFILILLLCRCINTLKNRFLQIIFLISSFISFSFLFDFFMKNYLKIKNYSWINLNLEYDKLNNFAKSGNTSIDILKYSYFERMFLVLFRPLFFDAKSLIMYIISIENLITLLLVIYCLYSLFNKFKIKMFYAKFLLILCFIIVLFFSVYMYNLGLASRMRLMIFPLFFYTFIDLKICIFAKKNKLQ